MAKAETATNRAPRGTKPVVQAFFHGLESVPDVQHKAVVRAALTMIRDEMKTRSDKEKTAKAKVAAKGAKAKTTRKAPAKTTMKATAKTVKTAKPKTPRSNGRKAPRTRMPVTPEPVA